MSNSYSLEAREKKARRKGLEAGYKVSKGFQRYHGGGICKNCNGKPYTGYNVEDLSTGILVWDCYNSNYDHLWTIDDVENFLKTVYKEHGLKY